MPLKPIDNRPEWMRKIVPVLPPPRDFEAEMAEERPIIARLRAIGTEEETLDTLAQRKQPLTKPEVDVLLECLPWVREKSNAEWILRCLGGSGHELDGTPIINVVERFNGHVSWVVMDLLTMVPVRGVQDWLARLANTCADQQDFELLPMAIARQLPIAAALPLVRQLVPMYPGHAAIALGQIGVDEDREVLLREAAKHKRWIAKEMRRSALLIESRIKP